MKQNEKLLVYAVTGFLVVILGIAVLFGKDGGKPQTPEPKNGVAQNLGDILKKEKEAALGKGEKNAADASGPGANTGVPAPGDVKLGSQTGGPLKATPPPAAADEVRLALGPSRQEHGYRVVKAKKGDILGKLVQTWCGSLEQLELAKGINENWEGLKAGDDVTLPWVDDEKVLAAWREAHPLPVEPVATPNGSPSNNPAVANGPAPKVQLNSVLDAPKDPPKTDPKQDAKTEPAAPTAMRTYKVKPGESLWKIAAREVGNGGADAFIEQIKLANPKITSFTPLKAGVELRIPPKPSQS